MTRLPPPENPEVAYLDRWRGLAEYEGLTWGRVIVGDDFVKKAWEGLPQQLPRVLEFGFGYGRIPLSMRILQVPFSSYVGLDISASSHHLCTHLFTRHPRFTFLCLPFSEFQVRGGFDLFLSSLTMKHQFPDFSSAMQKAFDSLVPGGLIVFDLAEGDEPGFWTEHGCFTRQYTKEQAVKILTEIGFRSFCFSEVLHGEAARLLVKGVRP